MKKSVIAVDRIAVLDLVGYQRVSDQSVTLSSSINWQPVSIRVPARLTVSEKMSDGVRLYTAQLDFHTCSTPGDLSRQAYRLTLADGQQLLLGSPARPFPVGTATENHPDNLQDSQLWQVSVAWTTPAPVPQLL